MKLNLNSKELSFLEREFGISKDGLMSITKDEWKKIKEKCIDIDTEEAIKQEETGNEYSERGIIADRIIDKRFSELYSE